MALAEILDVAMFLTLCAAVLLGYPVALTLAGVSLAFAGLGTLLGVFNPALLGAFPQRIYGIMTNQVWVAVPLFILMGVLLERSRAAEQLLEATARLFGRVRGGLGLAVCAVGALLAASTGIVGATVVTMGLLALPTMLRAGYDPRVATGTICAAGTLGQIIPPSIVLILLGEVMGNAFQQAQMTQGIFAPETLSVGDLFAGALLPGLMLVGLYMTWLVLVAVFRPAAMPAPAGPPPAGPVWRPLMAAILPPAGLIVAVLGSILGGLATPTEAAAVGSIGALLLAGHRARPDRPLPILLGVGAFVALIALTATADLRLGRPDLPTGARVLIGLAVLLVAGVVAGVGVALWRCARSGLLKGAIHSAAQLTAMVFLILVGAALFTVVFRGLGGDVTVRSLLEGLPGGTTGALLAVMAALFVLGFFLDFVEITLVVVPIVAPVLILMGVDPLWLAILIAINLQTSFLTPPFGFALFYLRGVAPPGVETAQIYRGALPFIGLQLLALAILWTYPPLATWLPGALTGR